MKTVRPRTFRPFLMLIAFLLSSLASISAWSSPVAPSATATKVPSESELLSERRLMPYQGRIIEEIRIRGNTRTKERAIRWLLGGTVGEPFSAERWIFGIKKLFNTTALYDIDTHFAVTKDGGLRILVTLKDKWTLLPFASFQGSSGNTTLSVGVYDVNLGGYFTQVSAGLLYYNTILGFDVNAFQEYLADTDWVLWVDVQSNPISFDVNDVLGNALHAFAYSRHQLEIGFGRRIGTIVRLYNFADLYQDVRLDSASVFTDEIYSQLQYRLHPQLFIGRSDLTNYLEDGWEFRLLPVAANFFSGSTGYYELVAQFKQTMIFHENTNLAYFLNAGYMNAGAPIAYQFRLGGFDTVRGFGANRFLGNLYANGNVELRPTLVQFRWNFFGLDLIAVQGAGFVDGGWIQGETPMETTPGSLGTSLALVSAGVGVRFNFVKISGAIVRFDLARTISPDEGFGYSFGVGQFF